MICDVKNNRVERELRNPASHALDFCDIRDTSPHIFETWFICVVVGDFGDDALRSSEMNDLQCEAFNRNLVIIADVEDFTNCRFGVDYGGNSSDGVVNMAEATGLLP